MEKDKGKDKGTVPVSFFAAAASPAPTYSGHLIWTSV
jgi:hypothetical protein